MFYLKLSVFLPSASVFLFFPLLFSIFVFARELSERVSKVPSNLIAWILLAIVLGNPLIAISQLEYTCQNSQPQRLLCQMCIKASEF